MKEIIRPLYPEEGERFCELVLRYIPQGYDQIDENFPQHILLSYFKGYDPFGYFTLRKTIWVLEYEGKMSGFVVATEKRGGSVKFGPTIIEPAYQGRGFGLKLWQEVEEHYAALGKRKVYGTWPAKRIDVLRFATKAGWKLEALLREHYRPKQDEYVSGKMLQPSQPFGQPSFRQPPARSQWEGEVSLLKPNQEKAVADFLLSYLPLYYDDIDAVFVRSVIAAHKRFGQGLHLKGKRVFVATQKDRTIGGIAIATPKRGGSVKVGPLVLSPYIDIVKVVQKFIATIKRYFFQMKIRKLYTITPIYESQVIWTFRSLGFEPEGLLREPYKAGVDMVVLGHLS